MYRVTKLNCKSSDLNTSKLKCPKCGFEHKIVVYSDNERYLGRLTGRLLPEEYVVPEDFFKWVKRNKVQKMNAKEKPQ